MVVTPLDVQRPRRAIGVDPGRRRGRARRSGGGRWGAVDCHSWIVGAFGTSGPCPDCPGQSESGDDRSSRLVDAHGLPADEVARRLDVDPTVGLTAGQAALRAIAAGPNALEVEAAQPVWRLVLGAATEPFVILLIVAGILALAVGEIRDGLLVLLALLPIVGADVFTEYRSERALEALREASAPSSRVRRDGVVTDLPAVVLVPGDVVLLRTGDVVPADLRLWRVDGLQVDRSVLTGESVPEPGRIAADVVDVGLAQRGSMAHSGTSIVGGRGEGIVVAIGAQTEVGQIAGEPRQRGAPPLAAPARNSTGWSGSCWSSPWPSSRSS